MKTIKIIIISFFSLSISGQVYLDANLKHADKEQAVYYREISEKDGKFIDRYFHLDHSPHEIIELKSLVPPVREGVYKSYYNGGDLHYEIEYKNGKKDGLMIGYYPSGKIFRKDLYKEDSLVSGACFDIHGNDTTYFQYIQIPVFESSEYSDFHEYIHKNVVYPMSALENGIEGRVIITFAVDQAGEVTDVEIVDSSNPLFNTSAISVVNRSPQWIPGKCDGVGAKVKMTFPIYYGLGY